MITIISYMAILFPVIQVIFYILGILAFIKYLRKH